MFRYGCSSICSNIISPSTFSIEVNCLHSAQLTTRYVLFHKQFLPFHRMFPLFLLSEILTTILSARAPFLLTRALEQTTASTASTPGQIQFGPPQSPESLTNLRHSEKFYSIWLVGRGRSFWQRLEGKSINNLPYLRARFYLCVEGPERRNYTSIRMDYLWYKKSPVR